MQTVLLIYVLFLGMRAFLFCLVLELVVQVELQYLAIKCSGYINTLFEGDLFTEKIHLFFVFYLLFMKVQLRSGLLGIIQGSSSSISRHWATPVPHVEMPMRPI